MSGELHKIEVLLIASALLVVKTENIYWNPSKMHKTMEAELRLLETALHHKEVHWLHHRCYMDEHKSVQCH